MLRNLNTLQGHANGVADGETGHARDLRWTTSSFGTPADTSPMELATLGEHVNRCTAQRGALSALCRAGEAVNDFAAPRVMTTLALFALLVVGASLLS